MTAAGPGGGQEALCGPESVSYAFTTHCVVSFYESADKCRIRARITEGCVSYVVAIQGLCNHDARFWNVFSNSSGDTVMMLKRHRLSYSRPNEVLTPAIAVAPDFAGYGAPLAS